MTSGNTDVNGRFLVITSCIAFTSFVKGRASPKIRAGSGINDNGKKAPIKNWSGTLIRMVMALAASSFLSGTRMNDEDVKLWAVGVATRPSRIASIPDRSAYIPVIHAIKEARPLPWFLHRGSALLG